MIDELLMLEHIDCGRPPRRRLLGSILAFWFSLVGVVTREVVSGTHDEDDDVDVLLDVDDDEDRQFLRLIAFADDEADAEKDGGGTDANVCRMLR